MGPIQTDPARRLNIDIETRSTVDLRKTSVYEYANHLSTEILLVRYAWENNPLDVKEWKVYAGEQIPFDLFRAFTNTEITLVAHNANFERILLNETRLCALYGIPKTPIGRWDDTAARAARMALPRSLEMSARALDLPVQKDMEGARIMMQLCKPRAWTAPDEATGQSKPVWWEPEQFPEKYQRLSDYCATDVRVGISLSAQTRPLPDKELEIWRLTEEINDRGLYVDRGFAETAARVAGLYLKILDDQMYLVTNGQVDGARKVTQLKDWCASKGYMVLDLDDDEKLVLDKNAVAQLLARDDLPDDVRAALTIRREAAKSSVAKYEAIVNRSNPKDNRVRGTLVYHGASTGRWAGAGIQPQNFPRQVVTDWDAAAADVYALDKGKMSFDEFAEKHGSVMDILSRMLRGVITAPEGKELIYPDYSAVEARGVAWVAGADSLVKLFASGGKVYETFAAQYLCPAGTKPEDVTKDSKARFLGKTVILGAGYGMGWKKFQATCAAQGTEVSESDAQEAIGAYRGAYPEIPALWAGLEEAAKAAVCNPGTPFTYSGAPGAPQVSYCVKDGWLLCKLPSGRLLFYRKPRLVRVATEYGMREVLEYSAVNSLTKKWERETTWGGKLTENVVQAVCRDLIAEAMLRFRDRGYSVVGTVHDEVILEVDAPAADKKDEVLKIMCEVPDWAKGFPLAADVGFGKRYGK